LFDCVSLDVAVVAAVLLQTKEINNRVARSEINLTDNLALNYFKKSKSAKSAKYTQF